MLDMVRKDILPAMSGYSAQLGDAVAKKIAVLPDADCSYEKDSLKMLTDDMVELAEFYKSTILDDMRELRIAVDEMETVSSAEAWPYPSYGELLFGVR